MKIYTILLVILEIFIIIGCTNPSDKQLLQNNGFSEHLHKLTHSGYIVSEKISIASSGGGSSAKSERVLSDEELQLVISALENIMPIASFNSSDRECYYSSGNSPIYYVCFSGDKIVEYAKYNGPEWDVWNVPGYDTIERSLLLKQIAGIQGCKVDSDCDLVSLGVCDINGSISSESPGYDNGCRASLNKEHSFIWDMHNFIEDICIKGTCADQGFEASCKEGKCVAVPLTN